MEEKEAEFMLKRGGTLGKGSYGFVSLAFTDTDSPMNVPYVIAVKSCTLSHSQSLQNERKFLRMFDACPQIIRFFGFKVTQEDDSHLYNLLLAYASVGSVADRLGERGLPEFQVQKHTKNILLGLSLIHKKGSIHCDIKPHNILLTTTNGYNSAVVAKIADFGLALNTEQNRKQKQGLRGTKWFMAPESLLKQEYGPGVDIWALGCTVYEMITGKPLWESSNSEPNFENPKLSPEAKDFLNNCLVKNPSSRWTADMLLNHSFLKIADIVQLPEFTRKRPGYFSRLRQNKALRRQTPVRDMVTEIGADSESGNSELGTDSEGRNSELGADSEGENSGLGADS
ncbi:mitogen-activated protein kinase kinase kinase 20-like [Solanum stenotomum]|uniref:mitogen-activated protein kinase kinase kinase 20-like n=1 Tax=Solanum stenotomum TaxID=172797 RepID=UPI0020D0BD96|nr:mitogen-activated protein kinase kinase kinase 20-like [Solanum stenotomum]